MASQWEGSRWSGPHDTRVRTSYLGTHGKGQQMKLKRAIATGVAVVVAGFAFTSCSSDGEGDGGSGDDSSTTGDASDAGDSPDDATLEDFCAVWNDDSIGSEDDDPEEQAKAAHEAAGLLAGVGTPDGMDEGARNGFEVFVKFLAGVDGDDIEKFASASPDADAFADALGIDTADADDVIAFITYASQNCYVAPTEAPTP
jgi:hypothetical protein